MGLLLEVIFVFVAGLTGRVESVYSTGGRAIIPRTADCG
jgi:hypothetical protein